MAVFYRPVVVFIFSVVYVLPIVKSETYESAYWQTPFQIVEYSSFRNVRILEFTIPELCVDSIVKFTSIKSDDSCPDRHADVYIQYGSYPVINPLNETYPENFNLQRTQLQHIPIPHYNSTSNPLRLSNPLPGSWFAAAFINDYTDDSISQKGLSSDDNCAYFLAASQIVDTLDTVLDLVTDVSIPIKTTYSGTNDYRFHIRENTWQYTINIRNCYYTNRTVSDNSTYNNNTLEFDSTVGDIYSGENYTNNESIPECPLIFAVRSSGLADFGGFSHEKDCSKVSNGSTCTLKVNSPVADDWQYLLISPRRRSIRVSFELKIDTKDCMPYQVKFVPVGDGLSQLEANIDNCTNSTGNCSKNNTDIEDDQMTQNETKKLLEGVQKSSTVHTYQNQTLEVEETGTYEIPGRSIEDEDSQFQKGVPKNNEPGTNANLYNASADSNNTDFENCAIVKELGRIVPSDRSFQVHYTLRIQEFIISDHITAKEDLPTVMKFYVKPIVDIGGTLKFGMSLVMQSVNTSAQNTSVTVCLQRGGIPLNDEGVQCIDDNKIILNTTDLESDYIYVPYPEPGNWYIALESQCYNASGHIIKCIDPSIVVEFLAVLEPCVDGGCTSNGECRSVYHGVFYYTVCYCFAGWRGYGCTDGSLAKSDAEQLEEALLLTMSNLLFIPAILVAIFRRFYVEALVYFYTMFMSTFYHACDGDRTAIYCMMPYNVLSFTDFYGAILSFWVTMVNMARLSSEKAKSFLFMLAALAIAIGVQWDKHSLWTFLVPTLTALGFMGCSWMMRCFKRKALYPPLKRWLFMLIPGILFAGTGLIIYARFETESNYAYTHSTWHACMALCIVFLLPPRKTVKEAGEGKEYNIRNSSSVSPIHTNQNGVLQINSNLSDPDNMSYPKTDREYEAIINAYENVSYERGIYDKYLANNQQKRGTEDVVCDNVNQNVYDNAGPNDRIDIMTQF